MPPATGLGLVPAILEEGASTPQSVVPPQEDASGSSGPFWSAALDADQRARASASVLGSAWEDLVRGRLTLVSEGGAPGRVLLVGWSRSAPAGSPPPLADEEARMVARILSGEAQKSVANDLRVAPSTTSRRYRQARRALGLETRGLPLTVVLAAQSWTKVTELPEARSALFDLEGRSFVTVSVPRPMVPADAGLTDAQQDAAAMLIAGLQPREIAARRFISVHTALRHVHAVYRKLNAPGRHALIRHAAGSGWFR